jgi:hypothetical protein
MHLYFSTKRLARTNRSKPMLTKTKMFSRIPILQKKIIIFDFDFNAI